MTKFFNCGCKIKRLTFAVGLAMAIPAANATVSTTLNFAADFSLDLTQAMGGTTLGQLVDTTYGAGTGTGPTVAVTGSLTYDPNTPVFQQYQSTGQGNANYLSPITGMTLNFWNTDFDGNISGMAASTDFLLQTDATGSAGCIGPLTACAGTPTANAAFVSDNTQFSVTDINGNQTFESRDSIVFGLGFSASDTDFISAALPRIYSDADGTQFFIWGFQLTGVGNPNEDLWSSAALPSDASFFDPANLDYVSLNLILVGVPEGDIGQAFPLAWESNASQFSVTSVDDQGGSGNVPVPAPLALILGSGMLLTTLRRHAQRRASV